MYIKVVNNYLFTKLFVPECYKTQKMCVEVVNTSYFEFLFCSLLILDSRNV